MRLQGPYRPRVEHDVALPDVPDGLVVGGFDAAAQAELGIWLRLFQSADMDQHAQILYVARDGSRRSRRGFEDVLPPSRLSQVSWLRDDNQTREAIIRPDRPERTFAAIVREGIARLLVVGPPTEEVWEQFEALWNART